MENEVATYRRTVGIPQMGETAKEARSLVYNKIKQTISSYQSDEPIFRLYTKEIEGKEKVTVIGLPRSDFLYIWKTNNLQQ